jgi:hypothetical protein
MSLKHLLVAGAAAALILYPVFGGAEPAADAAPAEVASEFRSPADMTVDERRAIMETVTNYNVCVHDAAMKSVEGVDDIRKAADSALGACKGKLDDVGNRITGFKFDPGFARQFTTQIRNTAVHKLLPELVMKKTGG